MFLGGIGHLIEQGVREGDADVLTARTDEFAERYAELSGLDCHPSAEQYATLTLARHIGISARIPQRRPWTEPLLELCERRLGVCHVQRSELIAV